MAHDCAETQSLLAAQQTMFRIAERDHGITQKLIHLETRMSPSAIGQYARGESVMSGVAIRKLAMMQGFPSELISLLFDGTGRHVADDTSDEPDFDAIGIEANGVAGEVARARSPSSPGGIQIVRTEKDAIRDRVRRFNAKAAAA
jgi:hypothetical protein